MNICLPIDLLIRLKNAYKAGNKTVVAPRSKFNVSILKILEKHSFIDSFSTEKDDRTLQVKLAYQNDLPAIEEISIFSKPGRRIYHKASSLPWGKTPNSLIIVSTSQGLMSQKQAKVNHLGGEIIAEIF